MSQATSLTPNGETAAPPISPNAESGMRQRRILIVEDNDLARRQLQHLLQQDPQLAVDTTSDGTKALEDLIEHNYSIVITDLRMPNLDGMDLIREVQQRQLPVTVIVTTGHGSIDEAVQAIRLGAYDFLTKPIDVDNLRHVVQRALRERTLQDEVAHLREQLKSRHTFHDIISKHPRMYAVFELISNVAHTNTTVLIEGETGTGKEQVARAIHAASIGRTGPMVAINCAALPETLLESELFGHEKGAFTSAVGQRRGRFELAHGGTILLDEVGDVPATMQAKLLRVLQERRFERVGGATSIEVDVRVIAATNRPLQRLVKQGTFREDLFYRLNVVKIDLPPLRERLEDVPLLASHFAQKYAPPGEEPKQISPAAMQVLLNYRWPGNIRELENVIERASVTTRGKVIEPDNLPQELTAAPPQKTPFHIDLERPLPKLLQEAIANIEQSYIRKALKKARGNVGRCARICGLSRRSVTAKIAEYKIDKAVYKEV
jgi:DNA-binding NtrC family response regulator